MPSFPTTLPAARTPPSAAAPALRWGVLGTGWIAERFVGSLQRHTRQQLLAVGSRAADRSRAFAGRHGLPRSYGSYEQLVADPDLDVVYVATPHPDHHPCARLALEAAGVARCVASGRLESPLRPLAESVATLRVMDEVRRQLGVAFPGEHGPPSAAG